MQPVEIPDEHSEFLEVDIYGKFGCIRTINCYGPQENMPIESRTEFFGELESRIISAKENQKLICLQFDANSKLGKNISPGTPIAILRPIEIRNFAAACGCQNSTRMRVP